MGTPDLITAVVVGAVVGLFFVALGHSQMVWLSRRKARDAAARERTSPLRTLASWTAALVAALCFLRAATTRALPDRPGFLAAEDLLLVRARPGLVAAHETRSADVRRGEPLVRFTGQDGEEAHLAIRSRRQQLAIALANERMRPLDLDAETARRAEAARAALRDHDQRLKQLASERDGIQREITSQRLSLDGRRFRIEQEDRDAALELEPLGASVATERDALGAAEQLLARGVVSRMETARERDSVARLEGRVRQLQDRRALLARERAELASLRALADRTIERQLDERANELRAERDEIETARTALAAATAGLELDRPRAEAERRRRLHELETQLADCDALLDGRGPELVVTAPWDGRIGFREPLPASVPADGGPLLVAYRPGRIAVTVRLEPGEVDGRATALEAAVQVGTAASAERSDGAGVLLPGTVVRREQLPDGAAELRIATDPPDRVVRQLAMGATVPVVARISRSFVSVPSFRLGLALAALAAGLMLYGSLRRHAGRSPASRRHDRGPAAAPAGWSTDPVQVWPSPAPLPPAVAVQADADALREGARDR